MIFMMVNKTLSKERDAIVTPKREVRVISFVT